MANVIYVQPNGVRETVDVPAGMTVMQGAVDCDIDGIMKHNSRMACRIVVTPKLHGLVIHIPSTQG